MQESLRPFYCARCDLYCEICGRCDRGNIYCGSVCARAIRMAGVKAAGKRYQETPKGACKHAKRQANYRARLQAQNSPHLQKVTHQGSPLEAVHVVLPTPSKRVFDRLHGYCHFCGCLVGDWLRQTFYKRRGGFCGPGFRAWPQGP